MSVTAVFTHYNGGQDLQRAVTSLWRTAVYPDYKVVVWDDGSRLDDGGRVFATQMAQDGRLHLIQSLENVGPTIGLNRAARLCLGDDILRMDADTEYLYPGWLARMVSFLAERPDVGIVAPLLVVPDGVSVHSAGQRIVASPQEYEANPNWKYMLNEVFDGAGRHRREYTYPLEVDAVLGCCALVRQEVWQAIGGVDETYFGWTEDLDMCVAARKAGYKVYVLPDIVAVHHCGGMYKRPDKEAIDILRVNFQHFANKWGWHPWRPWERFDEILKRWYGTEITWRYNGRLLSEVMEAGTTNG